MEVLQHVGSIIIIVTLIAGGALALYGIYDKVQRERRRDTDGSEDRLIDLLKKTVDELEKKVDKQTVDIETLTKKMQALETENETLVKVLQGRDEETQKFQAQVVESMKLGRETHDLVTTLAKNQEVTNTAMTKLIELLGKHVDVLDHKERRS